MYSIMNSNFDIHLRTVKATIRIRILERLKIPESKIQNMRLAIMSTLLLLYLLKTPFLSAVYDVVIINN